jgi:hypothetical protein
MLYDAREGACLIKNNIEGGLGKVKRVVPRRKRKLRQGHTEIGKGSYGSFECVIRELSISKEFWGTEFVTKG